MADLITDEMVDTFAVVGSLEEVPAKVLARFDGLVDRFSFYAPYEMGPAQVSALLAGFKA
jgi:hypothetical protein